MRKILSVLLFACLIFSSFTAVSADTTKVNATVDIVVEGFDWGPAVTKAVLHTDKVLENLEASNFAVVEKKQAMNWVTFTEELGEYPRTITEVYYSDAQGNKSSKASEYVAIEMVVDPNTGSPFFYDIFGGGVNKWANPYQLTITYAGSDVELTVAEEVSNLITPVADQFKSKSFTSSDNITMNYGYYEPAKDSKKNALLIWLHGAGEGGNDTLIDVLGNRVTGLLDSKVQASLGNAYILTPQSPTMWMNDGTGNYTATGKSMYTSALMELIKNYVDNNSDIDTSRIYISGCSNGGYMTMNMIMTYPDYFAAAVPICEAYSDAWISDEMLQSIKDLPIWFIHAATDTTVDPKGTTLATYDRLVKMGAKNIHNTFFDNVVDLSGTYKAEDGSAYEYMGHWSWIYYFNNQVSDGSLNLYDWMGQQVKTAAVAPTTSSNPIIKDTAEQPLALYGLVAFLIALLGISGVIKTRKA